MVKKLQKDKLREWLKMLSSTHLVFAPVRKDGILSFASYQEGAKLDLDALPVTSPKEIIFSQTETILSYSYQKEETDPVKTDVVLKTTLDYSPAIIFGAQPCEARGFIILDQVLLKGNYQDPYYREKRAKTILITVSCQHPASTCFCHLVGGGPADSQGSDIMLTRTENGDSYLVESFTDKGNLLLDKTIFESVQKEEEEKEAITHLTVGESLSLPHLAQRLTELFDTTYWSEVAEGCLSCGICTYLCPTCHCFNITDEGGRWKGRRVRSWDSCMFPFFTREASGHNPRKDKFSRYRQRINHKFNYFVTNYGLAACVGCGRCIRFCPAYIDLRMVINEK